VLALTAINALGVAAFAVAYTAAGLRWLSQGAFLVSLVVAFVAICALWVRTERSHAFGRTPLERLGRAAAGLVLVAVLAPGLLLTPIFALQPHIPEEAGAEHLIGRLMVLLLVSLALVAIVNVAGAVYIGLVGLRARRRSP
jgi:hypothetical protein